jgi:hypothetical protein
MVVVKPLRTCQSGGLSALVRVSTTTFQTVSAAMRGDFSCDEVVQNRRYRILLEPRTCSAELLLDAH